jgi:hypothetical protein
MRIADDRKIWELAAEYARHAQQITAPKTDFARNFNFCQRLGCEV